MLVDQYNQFEPLPGLQVNGELTLGENIADLTGLVIAHRAYLLSLKGKPAPTIDGLSGDQRFYMGWAQAWAGKKRDDALRQQVLTDLHSPDMFRANGTGEKCAGVLRDVRRQGRRQAVSGAGAAREDLVGRTGAERPAAFRHPIPV